MIHFNPHLTKKIPYGTCRTFGKGLTVPDTVIKAQVFIKTIFMLLHYFYVDQQCLFTSVCAHTRNKHNPTVPLSPAQILRTSINTNYNFWQQNPVAMNKSQIVPFLTALKFYSSSYFPMKTTKFPPNVIQLSHT